jgi:hypothetical protein
MPVVVIVIVSHFGEEVMSSSYHPTRILIVIILHSPVVLDASGWLSFKSTASSTSK